MKLDVDAGLALILKAMEKSRDERIFQQWVSLLPNMDHDNYISFADYRDRVTGANIDRRSVAEIMKDLDEVERELQRGGDS